MDEQQAIQDLKRGDLAGLRLLVERYQLKAIRTAYLVTRDAQVAEDVVQDCFLRLHRSIAGFDSTRSFEPWFLRSVVHAALKVAQKEARKISLASDDDRDWLEGWLAEQETVEAQVESAEFQTAIWSAMAKLSPRQRSVIVQRYFLEMSEKEMAVDMGTAPGTVKWLLNAARTRLRELLGFERSAR